MSAALRRVLDRYGDAALAIAAAVELAVQLSSYDRAEQPAAFLAAAGTGLVLWLRRRLPALTAAVVLIGFALLEVVAPGFMDVAIVLLVAFVVVLYSLGRHARGLEAWCGPVAVVAATVVLEVGDGDGSPAGIFFYLSLAGVPWGAGLAARLRVDRVREQRERNAALEDEARRAVAHERARIARELHDVVSHAIAVTVLQARGAQQLVGRDDEGVRRALTAIESTNTAALADMRRLLALLRDAEGAVPSLDEPAPTLDRLDELADQVRSAGVQVALVVDGDRIPVTPGIELCAYRIVQEALTNVLRHAGPGARADVHVRFDADDLALTVRSTGTGPSPEPGGSGDRLPGGGHGLAGISERVSLLRGTVAAGPDGAGWRLHAVLPYAPAPVVP